MNDDTLNSRTVGEARKAFGECLQPLERSMRRLGIGMPPYAKVSGIFLPLPYIGVLTTRQFVRTFRRGFQNSCKSLEMLSRGESKAMLGLCGQ